MTPDTVRSAAKQVIATSAEADIVPAPQALAEFDALLDRLLGLAVKQEGQDG